MECPPELEELWGHYKEIRNAGGIGYTGPVPITFADIHYYNIECEVQLTIAEKLLLRRIDERVLPVWHKKIKHRMTGKPDPVIIKADQPGLLRSMMRSLVGVKGEDKK